jgi:hypothetical protein
MSTESKNLSINLWTLEDEHKNMQRVDNRQVINEEPNSR